MIEATVKGKGYELFLGDCLEILPTLPAGSVDAVMTDPPYGTTELLFDRKYLDWRLIWSQIKAVSKANSVTAMFSAQPFTTDLIMSNRDSFRYEVIWCKTMGTNFLDANKRPMRAHENVLIFAPVFHGNGNPKTSTYNPQKETGKPYKRFRDNKRRADHYNGPKSWSTESKSENGERFPFDWQVFSNGNNFSEHPTQKPVDLMKWLVLTYSNEGDTILDPFMGSGTTGVACVQLGRRFIGVEIDKRYFEIAEKRIRQAAMQLRLPMGEGVQVEPV